MQPERISFKTIWESILGVLNLEKGALLTIKDLATQPGEMIRSYLFTEKRFQYAKPFSFLLFFTAIGTLLTVKLLAFGSGQTLAQINQFPEEMQDYLASIVSNLKEYFNLYNLSQIPFFALGTYLFFRAKKYNYAEHLVINSYLTAFNTIIFILIFPTFFLDETVMSIFSVFTIIYQVYFFQKVFQNKLLVTCLKVLALTVLVSSLHAIITLAVLFVNFKLFHA